MAYCTQTHQEGDVITIRLFRRTRTGKAVYTLPPYCRGGALALMQNLLARGHLASFAASDVCVAVETDALQDVWEFRGSTENMQALYRAAKLRFNRLRSYAKNPA